MRSTIYRPLFASLALAPLAAATTAPSYSGYTLEWSDAFTGSAGTSPSSANWNIITGYPGVNDEWEEYTSSSANVQCSGGDTLQLVPWEDSSTTYGWTSGRIESVYIFTPTAGVVTRAEAEIRFGTNDISTKQGLWPAFWILGESFREGESWPACGELDIMETIDGVLTGYGTAHCGTYPGGVCNEGTGIESSIAIPDQSWHTWRIEWDRTSNDWETETITWYMDGTAFQTITGSSLTEDIWTALCHSELYFILDLAVGGDWVSPPLITPSS